MITKSLVPEKWRSLRLRGVETLVEPGKEMKICSFLWVYYGYPTSSYEGVNVEEMRYKCGSMLAKRGWQQCASGHCSRCSGLRRGACYRIRK